MDQSNKNLLKWNLSLAETLAFAGSVGTLVFALTSNFYSKEDANKLEQRVSNIEKSISELNKDIGSIAKGVEYIKGKLEPK